MLRTENLTKRYRKRLALDSVSISLEHGVYGLLGPNGSGKTTLLRCVAGVLRPSCGSVSHATVVGYLPQKFGMFRQLTVQETMEYFCSLKKIPRPDQAEMIADVLERVHLEDRSKDRVGSLSGGMVRRMGIAQALLGKPEWILLDEPTAGLDPEERLRFKDLFSTGFPEQTVILSTHIVEDVASVCNHILILHQGKIVAQCTPQELMARAEGCVFTVHGTEKQLKKPYVIVNHGMDQQGPFLRVLSLLPQPGESAEPGIEDGYLMIIHKLI